MDIIAETIGSFFFTTIVLFSGSVGTALQPLTIGLGLAAVIWAFYNISMCAINPMITMVLYLRGDLKPSKAVLYIIAEIIGGIIGFVWYKWSTAAKPV
jgi:glycerol uptake facilitator-like aquaporin